MLIHRHLIQSIGNRVIPLKLWVKLTVSSRMRVWLTGCSNQTPVVLDCLYINNNCRFRYTYLAGYRTCASCACKLFKLSHKVGYLDTLIKQMPCSDH